MTSTNLFPSSSIRIKTGCGNLYSIMDIDPYTGNITRLDLKLGKSGGCGHSWSSAVGELLQELVEAGAAPDKIAARMEGHRCQESLFKGALSCSDAIAKTLVAQYKGLLCNVTQPAYDAWMEILRERKTV